MALLFCDSFDHYDDLGTPNRPMRKWSASRNSGAATFIQEGLGRFGDGFGGQERWTYKNLGINAPTLIAGCAMNATVTGSVDVFNFWDAGTCHLTLNLDASNGLIRIYRGPRTTLIDSEPIPNFVLNSFFYYELKATIHDSAGVIEIHVNGSELINLTGQDTRNGANAYANRFRLASCDDTNLPSIYYDDVYVCDAIDSGVPGCPNDDLLGDVRVEPLYPNANGNSSQFDGSDGNSVDNYLLVDETSPDDDTTYTESSILAEKDTYGYTTPSPTTGTVYGIQILPCARKSDAGTRTMVPVSRLSTSEEDGASVSLTTSYTYYPSISEADPDGNQWTLANLATAEFGVKVDS